MEKNAELIEKQNVLIVCQANLNRSPTVEKFAKKYYSGEFNVKSAGIDYGYPNQINQELLDWADMVWVMDLIQYKDIESLFERHPPVLVLGISDQYDPDDPKLIDLLEWYFKKGKYDAKKN